MRVYFYDVNIATDTNPFRYCGEYYDTQSGTYYLRARYYNPSVGRFTTEDPIKAGLNWYAYCAGNPVTFVDPTGLYLIFVGTLDDARYIVGILQELTNDTLVPIAIEGRDNLYEIGITIENDDGDLPYGTELLRRIIYNKEENVFIRRYEGKNTYDYKQKTIFFNPDFDSATITIDENTGRLVLSEKPSFISLAHELIHADRQLRGVNKLRTTTTTYYFHFVSFPAVPITRGVTIDEFATVGLGDYFDPETDITENMIREEHGLIERNIYI